MTTRRASPLLGLFITLALVAGMAKPTPAETLGPEHKPQPHDWHRGDRR